MNINELFYTYLDCLQEETDNEYIVDLIEWLQTDDDEDYLEETDSTLTVQTGGGRVSSFGNRDIDRPDRNQKMKSKSLQYVEHIKKMLKDAGLGNAESQVVTEAAGRLDAALKHAKRQAFKRYTTTGEKPKYKKGARKPESKDKRTENSKNRRLRELLLARRKANAPKGEEDTKDTKKVKKLSKVSRKNSGKSNPKKATGPKEKKSNIEGQSNSAAAKRFWSYKSAAETERKHHAPKPPKQFGKIKGKVDGDIKGRFERYYGKAAAEKIRRGVAVKIAQGRQNLSGLAKGRGKGKWRKK